MPIESYCEHDFERKDNNEVTVTAQSVSQKALSVSGDFDQIFGAAQMNNGNGLSGEQDIACPNIFEHRSENENKECEENTKIESESKATNVSPKKYQRKSKTTEFAYLLERKAFRMMRKYYKEKFEFSVNSSEYKKNLPSMTAQELNTLICKFMEKEFSMLSRLLSEDDYERTRDALKTIILCDRYKKKERIIEGLDFSIFRNVLHKYNTRNLLEFLSDASNAYLYTHFYLISGQKSTDEQDDVQKEKLLQSMRHLMVEAANYLPSEINSIFEEIHNSLY